MTTLWTAFELLVNMYQAAASVYFVCAFLSGKKLRSFINVRNLLSVFMIFTVICLDTYIDFGRFKPAFSLAYLALLFVYAAVNFKCSIFKKLFASVFSCMIILLPAALCGNIAAVIFDENLAYLMVVPSFERFLVIISTQLLIFYTVYIALRLFNRRDMSAEQSLFQWAIVAVVLLISIIIGAYINFAALGKGDKMGVYSLFVFMCVILMNVLVCWLLMNFLDKSRESREFELLKKTQEYTNQYIDSLRSEYETVRKMRHDYKNSFITIRELLLSDKTSEAISQIDENIGEISETEVFINTNNPTVNAVVNAKLSSAKSFGIESSCACTSDISGVSDMDLTRLLSNILDNAITSCRENIGKRQINIHISADNSSYLISVKNTIDKSVIESNPQLMSTKRNKSEHGYGVKIIREIAEKYDGRSDFYEEAGMFCCSVVLRKKPVG